MHVFLMHMLYSAVLYNIQIGIGNVRFWWPKSRAGEKFPVSIKGAWEEGIAATLEEGRGKGKYKTYAYAYGLWENVNESWKGVEVFILLLYNYSL